MARLSSSTGVTSTRIVDETITNADILNGTIGVAEVSAAFDTAYGRSNGQAGILAPTSRGFQPSNLTLVANRGYILRVVPSRDFAVTSVDFGLITAASADDAVDVAIYSSALARITSAGATAGKLNGTNGTVSSVAISTTLTAGTVYYVGFSSGNQGGTAAIITGATWVNAVYTKLFGATAGLIDVDAAAASHVLPNPYVLGSASSAFPLLALRGT